jgi:hypothetical protein
MSNTPTSPAKVAANRQNAQKSTGPGNTVSTRYNAQKHGLLAVGVTELDDPTSYQALLTGLCSEFNPVGVVETFLVERMALAMLRVQRASRLEAEHVTAAMNPPITEGGVDWDEIASFAAGKVEVVDPGLPSLLSAATVEELDNFTRYETAHENRFHRAVNQLRQMQRDRQAVQPPATAPATAPAPAPNPPPAVASFGNPPPADTPAT